MDESIKFKVACGADIRRLSRGLNNMQDLKMATSKVFHTNDQDSTYKFFYYDSDEDRIEISDDEDFKSAIDSCKNSSIKFYVEKYDPHDDSFYKNKSGSERAEMNTGASSNSSRNKLQVMKQLVQSAKSIEEESDGSDRDYEHEYPVFLQSIKDADSCSEGEEEEDKEPSAENIADNQQDETRMHQRKNTEVNEHGYDVLEQYSCRVSSKSIPKGYKLSNSNDPRFDSFWAKCLSKQVQQQLDGKELMELKKEWSFQVKAEMCYDKEYNRKRYCGFDKAVCRMRVASGNKDERAKLAMIEENEPKMGNEDIIFCKKGSLISKSWIVKNVGCRAWPKNTKLLVNESDVHGVVVPMILDTPKPGDKMILTINYLIPENCDTKTDADQLTFNLCSNGFGIFGDTMQLTYHVDDELFDLKYNQGENKNLLDRVKLASHQ